MFFKWSFFCFENNGCTPDVPPKVWNVGTCVRASNYPFRFCSGYFSATTVLISMRLNCKLHKQEEMSIVSSCSTFMILHEVISLLISIFYHKGEFMSWLFLSNHGLEVNDTWWEASLTKEMCILSPCFMENFTELWVLNFHKVWYRTICVRAIS